MQFNPQIGTNPSIQLGTSVTAQHVSTVSVSSSNDRERMLEILFSRISNVHRNLLVERAVHQSTVGCLEQKLADLQNQCARIAQHNLLLENIHALDKVKYEELEKKYEALKAERDILLLATTSTVKIPKKNEVTLMEDEEEEEVIADSTRKNES